MGIVQQCGLSSDSEIFQYRAINGSRLILEDSKESQGYRQ